MITHDKFRMHKTWGLAEDSRAEYTYVFPFYSVPFDVDIIRGHIRTVVPNPSWLNLARPRLRGTPGDVCKSGTAQ